MILTVLIGVFVIQIILQQGTFSNTFIFFQVLKIKVFA